MKGNIGRALYAAKAKGTFAKAKMKATYHKDFEPPKEKHVQTIMWTLQGQNPQTTPEAAFAELSQRLIASKWAGVLKTMLIIHRGIDQVGPGYASRVADLNMPLQNFNDPSEKGSAHNKMIQEYWGYIKAKAVNHSRRNSALLAPQTERAKFFEKLSISELLKEVAYLNNQMANMVKIGQPSSLALRNYGLKITQTVVLVVLKDAAMLYRTLDMGITILIDNFGEVAQDSLENAIEQYKGFEASTTVLKKLYELGNHLPGNTGIAPPKFTRRSPEVMHSISSYAGEVDPQLAVQMSDLKLSKEEMAMQESMLQQFKEEKKRTKEVKKEKARNEFLVGDVIEESRPEPPPAPEMAVPQAPAQPTSIDLVMGAFNQPQAAAAPPAPGAPGMPGADMGAMNPQMQAMMQQYMTAMASNPMMTNPMMMQNPMMTANPMMPNPMMTNPMMGNPMMTNPMMGNPMVGNPMMTNPMMGMQQPQVKSNINPNSVATKEIQDPNAQMSQPGGMDLFGAPAPAANKMAGSNPFDFGSDSIQPSQPSQPKVYDQFGNLQTTQPQKSQQSNSSTNDPFASLF